MSLMVSETLRYLRRYSLKYLFHSFFNKAYEFTLFRAFDFVFTHLLGYSLEGKAIVKVFDGIKMRYSPIIGIEQILFDQGYCSLTDYAPREGDVVFDVGAFVGLYTALASRAVGSTGLVISVEPDPINFKWLVETCELNNLRSCIVINAALSDHDGLISLHRDSQSNPSSTARVSTDSSSLLKVRCYRFDTLREILGVRRVNIMKVDVEGHEAKVLKGCTQSLEEGVVRKMVIEVHAPIGENLQEILTFLQNFPDYKIEGFSKGVLFISRNEEV